MQVKIWLMLQAKDQVEKIVPHSLSKIVDMPTIPLIGTQLILNISDDLDAAVDRFFIVDYVCWNEKTPNIFEVATKLINCDYSETKMLAEFAKHGWK